MITDIPSEVSRGVCAPAPLDAALRALGLDPLKVGTVCPQLKPRLLHLPDAWAQAYSVETLSSRKTDMRRFVNWCRARGDLPFGSKSGLDKLISDHLLDLSHIVKSASLGRAGSTLLGLARGLDVCGPALEERQRLVMRACNREARDRRSARAPTPVRLSLKQIAAVATVIEASDKSPLKKLRDIAIWRIMSELMLRRSELTGFRLIDWQDADDCLVIAHAKADQAGEGHAFTLSTAAARALREWLMASGLDQIEGVDLRAAIPLFIAVRREGTLRVAPDGDFYPMAGRSVARIVKDYAKSCGFEGVSGHTLRRSMARILCNAGVEEDAVVEAGRWRSRKIMRVYAGLSQARPSAQSLLEATMDP